MGAVPFRHGMFLLLLFLGISYLSTADGRVLTEQVGQYWGVGAVRLDGETERCQLGLHGRQRRDEGSRYRYREQSQFERRIGAGSGGGS
jgi:hypothetical protein